MPDLYQRPSVSSLALLVSKTFGAAVTRFVTAPVRSRDVVGASTLYRDVFFAGIRAMLSNITIAQSRYLNKDTTDTYQDLCKEIKQEPNTVKLNGVNAHWVGREDADVVVLFLHGGGYTAPCTIGHMQYFDRLVRDINVRSDGQRSISVILPAYTLAPEAIFPTQLMQAATVLSHLLNEAKRNPSEIMITGDSAGGNLALGLLSHILHPHPDVPSIGRLEEPFRGVFLYSPWVSFDTTYPSFTANAERDCLVPDMLRKWAAMFLGTTDPANIEAPIGVVKGGNAYSEPLLAGPEWWSDLSLITSAVLVWAGEHEIFIDGLKAFEGKFAGGWKHGGGKESGMKWLKEEGGAHDGPIMDVLVGYKEKGESQHVIEEWLRERLM